MSTFGTIPFTPRTSNGLGIAALSQGKPAAKYPGAVATDAQLKIAVDRLQTKLTGTLDNISTTMTVADASQIVANVLLSIDNEIVWVTAAPTGNSVPITRGFDGTTSAIHLANALVSGFVDAWHHNTLVSEIEAIENALGANLSKIPNVALIVSSAYIFTPQSPGGSLGTGNQVVTLAPVPAGVNGTDTNHYLYISGGTGTAEPVLITGGTAVAGAPSGTVIVNCANTHSGAWTIQTATAGLQEAHNANPGALIFIPAGIWDWYGPFWSNGDVNIMGSGFGHWSSSPSMLQFHSLTLPMYIVQQNGFLLSRVIMQQIGTPVSGNAGICTYGSGSNAVTPANCNDGAIEDVKVRGFFNGIITDGGTSSFNLINVEVDNTIGDGIITKGTQGYWSAVVAVGCQGNGITSGHASGYPAGGNPPFMQGIQTYGNKGWGLYCTTWIGISGLPSFFNNDYQGEIYVANPGMAQGGWIKDAAIQAAGKTPTFGIKTTAAGLALNANTSPLLIDNLQILVCQGNGISCISSNHIITNCIISSSGQGATATDKYGIHVLGTGVNALMFTQNEVADPCVFEGVGFGNIVARNFFYGNYPGVLLLNIVAGTDWLIDGNYLNNISGSNSVGIAPGVTYRESWNLVNGGASKMSNFGTLSSNSVHLV